MIIEICINIAPVKNIAPSEHTLICKAAYHSVAELIVVPGLSAARLVCLLSFYALLSDPEVSMNGLCVRTLPSVVSTQ